LAAYPNVTRWFTTAINQPEFPKVLGKVEFAKKEQLYSGSGAGSAADDKAGKNDKKGGKKEEGSKKEEGKKKEEKPAAPAADPNFDEDDLKPRKPKSLLESLPPSPMVFDTIKKLAFSTRPILPTFFEQLWPQFDKAGYSWWTATYKYNDENKVLYMTGNAVGGFLQRSDEVRKWAMGVLNIYGNADEETPPFKISGAWCFRGLEIPLEMKEENPDSEYYEWKKIDIDTEKGKQAIKEQFIGDKLEGLPVLDRRYFK